MNTEAASALYSEIFWTFVMKQSEIYRLRQTARLGLNSAQRTLQAEQIEFAKEVFTSQYYAQFFTDQAAAEHAVGGATRFGSQLAADQIKGFQAAIDAATVVFAHSVLDALVMDCCRVTALAGKDRWEESVGERKVTLSQIKDTSHDSLLENAIANALDLLDRESVLKKIDRLFQVCRPPTAYQPFLDDFRFDRERLVDFDELRHRVVHGRDKLTAIESLDEEIEFVFRSILYCWALVNKAFGVKADVRHVFPKTPS